MLLNLNPKAETPLYQQIYYALVELIRTEQLQIGDPLPSQRQMAQANGVSVNTITNAYEQLVIEGYLEAKPRVGYFVANISRLIPWQPSDQPPVTTKTKSTKPLIDLTRSIPDDTLFPYEEWARIYQQLFRQEDQQLLKAAPLAGLYTLRQALLEYTRQARGVVAQPEQVVIGPSADYLLTLLVELLALTDHPVTTIASENPGYPLPPIMNAPQQLTIEPIAVTDEGLDLEQLKSLGKRLDLLYFTPNHQFPTGSIMPLAKRQQLLQWAHECDVYLIEDDYDSEFRYAGMPIPSFYHLDPGDQVIYMSSLTRNLAPGMRVSYMILPTTLLPALDRLSDGRNSPLHTPLQYALSEFIRSGQFQKHLNRSRRLYKQKREQIVHLFKQIDPNCQIMGEAAGLHIVMQPSLAFDAKKFVELTKQEGIQLRLIADYMTDPTPIAYQQLFISFSSIPTSQLEKVTTTIYHCLKASRQ